MGDLTGGLSRRQVLGALAAGALAVPVLGTARATAAPRSTMDFVYLGSWGNDALYLALFDADSGELTAAETVAGVSSSWAARHPRLPVLYVASGATGGDVYSFRIDPATGALTPTGAVATGGAGTVGVVSFLAVDAVSDTVLAANFAAGLAATVSIRPDGSVGALVSTAQDTGSGPNPRQDGPHPHCVVLDPSGRHALVADFGADRVFVYDFDRATGVLSAGPDGPGYYATAPGSGPRRLIFHPNGRALYLMNELTADIQLLDWHPATAELTHRATVATDPPTFTGTKSAAELVPSADRRFLYQSNRGENTLQVYAVDPVTAGISLVQRLDCGGSVPWSLALHRSGRWLFVANQDSDTVNLFRVDQRTGRLTDTGRAIAVPAPDGITLRDR